MMLIRRNLLVWQTPVRACETDAEIESLRANRSASLFSLAMIATIFFPSFVLGQPVITEKNAPPDQVAPPPADAFASQDQQFLALVRIRDAQLKTIAELQQISDYHQSFIRRVDQIMKRDKARTPEDIAKDIEAELARIDAMEKLIKDTADTAERQRIVREFDSRYPIFRSGAFPNDVLSLISTQRARTLSRAISVSTFAEEERARLNDILPSVSPDNRGLLDRYTNLSNDISQYIVDSRFWSVPSATSLPDSIVSLPQSFLDLMGAAGFDALTEENLSLGIEKYRIALVTAKDEVATAPDRVTLDKQEANIRDAAAAIGHEISSRNVNQSASLSGLENQIVVSAKSVYGSAVGSDSFNYLLVVFAAVFGVIMVVPRFYASSAVAENVLKAEFLLQFSTVFVLVAAIIILAIGKLIPQDQLPVLLAGISGYVLGQLRQA